MFYINSFTKMLQNIFSRIKYGLKINRYMYSKSINQSKVICNARSVVHRARI